MAALQRQVTQLQQKTDALVTHADETDAVLTKMIAWDSCSFGVLSDMDRGLFNVVAAIVAYLTNTPPQAPLTRFDDQGACAVLGITRSPTSRTFRGESADALSAAVAALHDIPTMAVW